MGVFVCKYQVILHPVLWSCPPHRRIPLRGQSCLAPFGSLCLPSSPAPFPRSRPGNFPLSSCDDVLFSEKPFQTSPTQVLGQGSRPAPFPGRPPSVSTTPAPPRPGGPIFTYGKLHLTHLRGMKSLTE